MIRGASRWDEPKTSVPTSAAATSADMTAAPRTWVLRMQDSLGSRCPSLRPRWPHGYNFSCKSAHSANRSQVRAGCSSVAGGQRERHPRAALGARLRADAAAVVLHDLAGDRQPDPGARIAVARVQALEHAEDHLGVLGVDADSVVVDREAPLRVLALRAHAHLGHGADGHELDRVGDQVLQELGELPRLA